MKFTRFAHGLREGGKEESKVMHGLMFFPSSLKKGILFSVDGEVFVKSGLGPRSFSLREQLGVWAAVASRP